MIAEHDCTLIISWEDQSECDRRRQPQALHLATDNWFHEKVKCYYSPSRTTSVIMLQFILQMFPEERKSTHCNIVV